MQLVHSVLMFTAIASKPQIILFCSRAHVYSPKCFYFNLHANISHDFTLNINLHKPNKCSVYKKKTSVDMSIHKCMGIETTQSTSVATNSCFFATALLPWQSTSSSPASSLTSPTPASPGNESSKYQTLWVYIYKCCFVKVGHIIILCCSDGFVYLTKL